MRIATRLAQKVTEKQGETWAWYGVSFILGYIVAKVLPHLWTAATVICFPVV